MESAADWLERRIPDVVSTADLPDPLAAEIDFLAGRTERWINDSSAIGPALHARALTQAGEVVAAGAVLAEIDPNLLSDHDLVAATWAVSRAGPTTVAESLLLRAQTRQGNLTGGLPGEEFPLGPTELVIGVLLATTGDLDGAASALRNAAQIGDVRAPLWGALARMELARVLRCVQMIGAEPVTAGGASIDGAHERVDSSAAEEADRALRAARTFFAAGGYRSLLARADSFDVGPGSSAGDIGRLIATHPRRGVLAPGRRWTVGFGIQPAVSMRASKGLAALHYLLANRHRTVPTVELSRMLDGQDLAEVADLATGELFAQLSEAKLADGQLAEGDISARVRAIFFDDSTRSRITKLLRRTIIKIGDSHRLLGLHLAASIGTGHACRYEPNANAEIFWQL